VSISPTRPAISIEQLRAAVRGRIITPDDTDYDAARTVTLGDIDSRPAAIVRVADAADVSALVSLARETGLELAVRCGGHSAAGHSTIDGGVVLDVRDLNGLDLDLDGRTAWAGSGLTAGEVTTALAEHGLAIGFGDTGSVGIGGITLGGGVGYLVRKHGLTIDNLLAAEIVTADGEVRIVDADHEPDLFWAIRGGGGNFGVATRFRYRLQELDGVVGGILVLPATPETIAGFIAAADAAPEELSSIANVMPCPPMPMVPEDRHGELVVFAFVTYAGDAESGAKVLAPFRALATPVADLVRPITYPEMYMPEEGEYHPVAVARTMLIDELDRGSVETIVDRVRAGTAMMRVAQIRVLGGAMARVPSDATAFAHRSSRFMVNVAALYENPDDRAEHEAWVDGLASALRKETASAYVNFLGDEGEARVREAYPDPTWERLVTIKRRYDPTNLFRLNQNIPPDGAGG
jgi:FAD/FMN-containing dehydrogenase